MFWKKDQSEAVEDVQDDLEMKKSVHLKFKGVPIDGTLKEFISRMERKGFEHRSSYDSKERLVSDFAGIKQCTVYVETLDNSDLVSRIIVEFPKQERWEELFDNYKNLKSMLMEKYGNFYRVLNDFKIPILEQMKIVCVPFIWVNVCIRPIFRLPREILHLV